MKNPPRVFFALAEYHPIINNFAQAWMNGRIKSFDQATQGAMLSMLDFVVDLMGRVKESLLHPSCKPIASEYLVLVFLFNHDLRFYLKERTGVQTQTYQLSHAAYQSDPEEIAKADSALSEQINWLFELLSGYKNNSNYLPNVDVVQILIFLANFTEAMHKLLEKIIYLTPPPPIKISADSPIAQSILNGEIKLKEGVQW